MDEIFRKLAKERGLTDEDINAYLGEKKQLEEQSPTQETSQTPSISSSYVTPNTPAPVPTPPSTSQAQSPDVRTPDVVNPFSNPQNETMTQGLNENPYAFGQGEMGHEGIDLVNDNPEMTNPIGGLNVAGTNPAGYGNWQAIIGASPEELAQMTQEEKDALRKKVGEYIINQPANIRGLDVEGKNVSLQAHLAEPAPGAPEIATGSANLKMGTGGTGPHLHQVYKDNKGNMRDLLEIVRSMQYR
jgi:hypothetical protein